MPAWTQLQRRLRDEDGQAIILAGLAMGFFLLLAVGLGIDGSNLYTQRTMAQTAADAAAQAAMMSIFNGTNSSGTAKFSTSKGFTCSTTDAETPCVYAADNGFGSTAADTVTVSFPTTAPAGVKLSPDFAVNLVNVQVSRKVNTFLIRLAGASQTTVTANATAAIVSIVAPVPILVNHPTLASSFSMNGGISVKICGGPHRSIEINSGNSGSISVSGKSGTIDLSKAGPPDPGDCTTGTGADFGTWGGPSSAPFTFKPGTTGNYLQPASWLLDPLASVKAPSNASFPNGTQATLSAGSGICPSSAGSHGCTVLTPGTYGSGNTLTLANTTAIFEPGIYYVTNANGFSCANNCNAVLGSVKDTSTTTGTGTNWDGTASGGGIMIYNAGAGQFSISSNANVNLIGSPGSSSYKGILFFENRAAAANNSTVKKSVAHSIGGTGAITLQGTIYMTDTRATMLATSTQYQELDLSGNGGGNTTIEGEIIVDALSLGGNSSITMNLNSNSSLTISQVALVQ